MNMGINQNQASVQLLRNQLIKQQMATAAAAAAAAANRGVPNHVPQGINGVRPAGLNPNSLLLSNINIGNGNSPNMAMNVNNNNNNSNPNGVIGLGIAGANPIGEINLSPQEILEFQQKIMQAKHQQAQHAQHAQQAQQTQHAQQAQQHNNQHSQGM
ncbi:hypothetical protein PHYBLDRAFT_157127 [Phycomyces blakesleeanus NRRL 1555(-)]|uniref:Uncharacterized protein n=2 Tax=Phycomyces blakesleeanus TaxID=4837 RepID=A0A162VB69_PHYB8|nr:hypothetical protein PHYBLDRAFT_157127 [Phycomyces blakesleeanus NRRL 1555(-)]OAD81392.1 hypothetical protein PHYBLDRAFT_157127 [Phycomyces blakesleeanus NRRL 1555(-)]|eukprot:XP_018299432.1 hypothetical protein PHYBLDRAFT_157127 [Phycomyces blakesleeanus NRRL 1555(-)]